MSEDLPDHEQRLLEDRLRRPQAAGDLEGVGAALVHGLDDALAAAIVIRQPAADELRVRGDVLAVSGVEPGERHRRRLPQALEVLDARPRARPVRLEGGIDLGVGGDLGQQVVAHERDPLAVVDQQRVRGAVPGARDHAQVAAAGADRLAVGQLDVGVVGLRLVADEVPEHLGVGQDLVGHPVVAHQREREAAVGLVARVVVASVRGRALVGRDARARAAGDRGGQAAVVEVVMRDQHQLDVLHAMPGGAQADLERRQRLVVARTGVDQRQRVTPQQPGVHRADVRQGQGDEKGRVHGPETNSSIARQCPSLPYVSETCMI